MSAHVDEQPVPGEDHSTGTAWSAPDPRPEAEPRPESRPWTRAEQEKHVADLLEGIAGHVVGRPGRPR
ncbi:hypothetical protein [Streptomyces sp. NPDC007110]|uniref:hypothetical protein n=1 Tax=Streptomyces sp. NPDC007110 TaxID=3156916 RepID=UPI0033D48ADF